MRKLPILFFFVQNVRSTVKDQSLMERLLNAITLVVTAGLTWIFGFMLLFPANVTYEEVMQWLFTVLNVFQVYIYNSRPTAFLFDVYSMSCIFQDVLTLFG